MRKLGVRFNPPALIMVDDNDEGNIHKRTMPIRKLHVDSNVHFIASQLRQQHAPLSCIPIVSIEKMLRILQENMKGLDLTEILGNIRPEFDIDPDEDMNKLTTDALQRKKLIMEATFTAHQIQPSDPDFQYDKQIDFNEHQIESGWDSDGKIEDGDDFWG